MSISENIRDLIEWRDEVNEKKKARAIQRCIDKLMAKLPEQKQEEIQIIAILKGTKAGW